MKSSMFSCIMLLAVMGAAAETSVGLLPATIGRGWQDGHPKEWVGSVPGLEVRDSRTPCANGLEKVVRRWTWTGRQPLTEVTLGVRVQCAGDSHDLKPFIPGVLMYGNPSNAGRRDGRVPVYAGETGEFAQFEDHRLPMPFVLLENAKSGEFTAVHTLPSPVRGAKRADLWWSAGVEAREDGAQLVLLSGPVGYNRQHAVAKARQGSWMKYDETYLTLQPGQVVEKTFWIQKGRATRDSFGFQQAMYTCLDLYKPYDASRHPTIGEIAKVKRDYALTRWMEGGKNGACGFDMYDQRFRKELVMGWCGCAATCGYALPVLDLEAGDWEKAQRSLDFLAETTMNRFTGREGCFQVGYRMHDGSGYGGDPVSCGQALYSFVKAIRFAEKSKKLDATKWRAFVRKAVSAVTDHVLRDDWQVPRSTSIGFFVAPLVVASELLNEPRALAAAEKIAGALADKYIGYDAVYWGGTLDASCEDKEGAYAAFQGFVELLRRAVKRQDAAGEKRWSLPARHALDFMLTYTMVWDATYPPGRLSDHMFKSTGWTVVSAQNQHLDAFGVLATPQIWWMGEYLKDARLQQLAQVMYRACSQLTDASGSLGEQIQHTNFAQQGDMSDVYKLRGGYSEHWTVFWLTAHFLNAAAEFRELGVN